MDDFKTEEMYNVSIDYYHPNYSNKNSVEVFLPPNNQRQHIISLVKKPAVASIGTNKLYEESKMNTTQAVYSSYSFTFEGKSKRHKIPKNFGFHQNNGSKYLMPSEEVQSNDVRIVSVANTFQDYNNNSKGTVQKVYRYVQNIPNSPTKLPMDARTTLMDSSGNSIGKSRLFAALVRSLGLPARLKSGMILQEENTGNINSWVEVKIEKQWIPFDVYENHFAYLPSNYLELEEGDSPEWTKLNRNNSDYSFAIDRQIAIPYLNLSSHEFKEKFPISLWGLIENKVISLWLLSLLVMIPVGGLIVAFLRNVVGLKTFGVFLPVLIAFSLMEIGFWQGLFSFVFLIVIVGLVTRPLKNLALMHTPKMVISLTTMVVVMLMGSYIGMTIGWQWLSALSFFPVIILTISAERFSNLIAEEGLQDALVIFAQTLLSVLICYVLLFHPLVSYLLILFPETLLIVIALAMLLGKYIGLRWSELFRFKPLLNFKS